MFIESGEFFGRENREVITFLAVLMKFKKYLRKNNIFSEEAFILTTDLHHRRKIYNITYQNSFFFSKHQRVPITDPYYQMLPHASKK